MKRRITALTVLSVALMVSNVAIQGLLAVFLGAGSERDALFVAMSVPLFLNTLMIASFGAVVTPAVIEREPGIQQWAVAGEIALKLGMASVVLIILLQYCRDGLIQILAPGFDTVDRQYTTRLFGITLAMVPFQSVTCVLSGYWIARERVFLPYVAVLAGNAVVVSTLVWIGGSLTGVQVAWYSLFGALLTFTLLGLMFLSEKRMGSAAAAPPSVSERSLYSKALPLLASSLVGRSAPLIERHLASGMGVGTISCLGYAGYLVNFLVNATAAPTATAYYAQMCRQWNEGRRDELSRFLERGTIFVFLASLTVAGVLVLGTRDVLHSLRPYTRFSGADLVELADYTAILMIAYVSMSFGSFIARIFYASGQFMHAALLDCAAVVFYVVLAVPLGRIMGGYGLVMATCAQMVLLAGLIVHGVRRRLGVGLPGRLWIWLWRTGLAWLCCVGAGFIVRSQMSPEIAPLLSAFLAIGTYLIGVGIVVALALPGMGVEWRILMRPRTEVTSSR